MRPKSASNQAKVTESTEEKEKEKEKESLEETVRWMKEEMRRREEERISLVSRLEKLEKEKYEKEVKCIRNQLDVRISEWKEETIKSARSKAEMEVLVSVDNLASDILEGKAEVAAIAELVKVVRSRADLLFDANARGWKKACDVRGIIAPDSEGIACYFCGGPDHLATSCPERKRMKELKAKNQKGSASVKKVGSGSGSSEVREAGEGEKEEVADWDDGVEEAVRVALAVLQKKKWG